MSLRLSLLAALAFALPSALAACGDGGSGTPTDQTDADTSTTPDEGGGDAADDTAATDDTTPATSCNAITQTGCEEGENCTYVGSGAKTAECVPEGEQPYGAECGGNDGCERGICLNLNDTKFLCYKFCKTDGHCEAGDSCLTLTDTPYKVCEIDDIYTTCDLLAQDCGGTKGCYRIAGQPEPVCLPAGNTAAGGACTNASDCEAGTACVGNKCYPLCDTTAVEPCPNFVGCSQYYGQVGYCDLP